MRFLRFRFRNVLNWERVLDSLGEAPDKERLERWAAETESRLDAIERGELETVPGEEVLARLRRRYS